MRWPLYPARFKGVLNIYDISKNHFLSVAYGKGAKRSGQQERSPEANASGRQDWGREGPRKRKAAKS
jgi:hypothetical protein